ncbi:hypothetical protein WQ54_04995 [Bacillus sp. SA1-12]|uniref:hypothetical protein n=1 Tax=Bacillus sp. SA1-12 TaxID=1455638 RepID=UPI000626A1D6|nr:hypothetical protein [Bacillus sp. SA1-12]KKI93210.1 hypothetical protein WQ54_04995 [Bacillus sp. SA1-12]
MKKFAYTKRLAVIAGSLIILGAIGYGLLALIAIGLSNAWNTEGSSSSTNNWLFVFFLIMLLLGILTAAGSFLLKRKAWKVVYTGFCLILGVGFVASFFISFGALGVMSELFLLFIGVVYMVLGYFVNKEK